MSSQISFTIDPLLKQKAMQKAKQSGISLKAVLVQCLDAFSKGRIGIQIAPVEESLQWTPELQKEWEKGQQDLEDKNYVSFSEFKK